MKTNAKIAVLKVFVQKSEQFFFWLKIMPLPGKFPGDAHAASNFVQKVRKLAIIVVLKLFV